MHYTKKFNKPNELLFKSMGFFSASSSTTAPYCGLYCNHTIVITPTTASGTYQWESANWGVTDYPDDCTCILNVQVRKSRDIIFFLRL